MRLELRDYQRDAALEILNRHGFNSGSVNASGTEMKASVRRQPAATPEERLGPLHSNPTGHQGRN